MQVHRTAKAIPKHLAISALSSLHPSAIAKRLETVFPNIQKVVLIDIALHKAAVDVRTGGNGAVNQDGTDSDASATEIEPVAEFTFVWTDIGFTTELTVYLPFFSSRDDEVHKLTELFIAKLQALVSSGATNWINGEQAPSFYLMLNK